MKDNELRFSLIFLTVASLCLGIVYGYEAGQQAGMEEALKASPQTNSTITLDVVDTGTPVEATPEPMPVLSHPKEINTLHKYPVEQLLRVVDGDTVDVRFHAWEDIILVKRIRLLGVDTPELRPRKGTEAERADEKRRALEAMSYVQAELQNAAAISIVTDWESDSFGRVLAGIRYTDKSGTEHDLAARLLKSGLAEPYTK